MLRDVVVHINNEQPMLVDLVAEPLPSDVALIFKNLRTMNGKKPVWADEAELTFLMPLAAIRFIEIHQSSYGAHEIDMAADAAEANLAAVTGSESANDALALRSWDGDADGLHGLPVEVSGSDIETEPANSDELDDDLLRRIREA